MLSGSICPRAYSYRNVNSVNASVGSINNKIKPLLSELMEDYGLTIEDIKQYTRVSKATIYRWLQRGEESIPFANYKKLLCLYCDCLDSFVKNI